MESVAISIASPQVIRSWSQGEVRNAGTINDHTRKPVIDGLFCERIFGSVENWKCSCGKYQKKEHRGLVCGDCGVEATDSRERRRRMGHIDLAVPVAHFWFFASKPSQIARILDMKKVDIEGVIYFKKYLVIDPKTAPLERHQVLTETEYRNAQEVLGEEAFTAQIGAKAVRDALSNIDLAKGITELEQAMDHSNSKQTRNKLAKRIRVFQGLQDSNSRPEWMILTVLPVMPPDLRPLVPLGNGKYAVSDVTELYRKVIDTNNRLRSLVEADAAERSLHEWGCKLQQAVDALFDNGRVQWPVQGPTRRVLNSIADRLGGKSGRFRQNLLGKRVDYSGRSVIVVGPELKLHQCGLPRKMALVLFEPFIIRRLKELGYAHTVRSAKRMIERQSPEVWDILEEVTKSYPVLLNRAPTLHRLSIQAFEPVLIEGDAIRVHPLVCTAYNADFDGDQMAVHVPLSIAAQMEARLLMMAPLNIFSPSSGKPIVTPTQDITLGCYYLTAEPRAPKKDTARLMLFGSKEEVFTAHANGAVKTHTRIQLANPDRGRKTLYGDAAKPAIETTVGRVIFSEVWPVEMGFFNRVAGKSDLGEIIWNCYQICGHERTIAALDELKELGFREATRSGCSIGIDDLIIPPEKDQEIQAARREAKGIQERYHRGEIAGAERDNMLVDLWAERAARISTATRRALELNHGKAEFNPLWMMVESGARGNMEQIRQLSGMRGLFANPQGEIIPKPVLSSLREGLGIIEYFISASGARKGMADTSLRTQDAGYLTRRLAHAAQNIVISEDDCRTTDGIWVQSTFEGEDEVVKLRERLVGRTACGDMGEPRDSTSLIVKANEQIDEMKAGKIQAVGIKRVHIRSVLTCGSKHGVCALCYGRNLATGSSAKLGDAVGIIAAQAIGERGTQLTLRTFHVGGTATHALGQREIMARHDGILRYNNLRVVESPDGRVIVVNDVGSIAILDENGHQMVVQRLLPGAVIYAHDGSRVTKGELLVRVDPYSSPILAEMGGRVEIRNLFEGVTATWQITPETRDFSWLALRCEDIAPMQIAILDEEGRETARHWIPPGARILVADGEAVKPSDVLAKTPREAASTIDITSALDQISNWFEATHPANPYLGCRIQIPKRPLLVEADLLGFENLLTKFTVRKPDGLSVDLWDRIPELTRMQVQNRKLGRKTRLSLMVDSLNKILEGPLIYSATAFSGIQLLPQTRAMLGEKPTGRRLVALNRMLLEEAYPREIVDSELGGCEATEPVRARTAGQDVAVIAEIDGIVSFSDTTHGERCATVTSPHDGNPKSCLIPLGQPVLVGKGESVRAGQSLALGLVDPHEMLTGCGPMELQQHLVDKIQTCYRRHDVDIDAKHLELIVRQMLRKVQITEPGDTGFRHNEQIDRTAFEDENQRLQKVGGKCAQATPVLLGITRASLQADGFLGAASFREPARGLTDAATMGILDYLQGFKEKIMVGDLIPAGTGFPEYRNIGVKPSGDGNLVPAASIAQRRTAAEYIEPADRGGDDNALLQRIISGGETGAERAALEFATAHRIPVTGWCPEGRKVEDGVIPCRFTLDEPRRSSVSEQDMARRTKFQRIYYDPSACNIYYSHATVVFTIEDDLSERLRRLQKWAERCSVHWLHLSKHSADDPVEKLLEFLTSNEVRTLNVTGSRISQEPDVSAFVADVLERTWTTWTRQSALLDSSSRTHTHQTQLARRFRLRGFPPILFHILKPSQEQGCEAIS